MFISHDEILILLLPALLITEKPDFWFLMIFSLLSLSCTLIRFSMSIQAFKLPFVRLYNHYISLSSVCKDRQPFGCLVMGSSGLEPPTSRLSGARSNLLSYEPVLKSLVIFFWDSQPTCVWSPCFIASVSISACRGFPTGDDGIRTHDPLLAGQVLSQLSYTPIRCAAFSESSLKIEQQTLLFALTPLSSHSPYDRRFSLERRWSSRTFRYGYLVTT